MSRSNIVAAISAIANDGLQRSCDAAAYNSTRPQRGCTGLNVQHLSNPELKQGGEPGAHHESAIAWEACAEWLHDRFASKAGLQQPVCFIHGAAHAMNMSRVDLKGDGWLLSGGEHSNLPVTLPVHALQALQDAQIVPDPLYR